MNVNLIYECQDTETFQEIERSELSINGEKLSGTSIKRHPEFYLRRQAEWRYLKNTNLKWRKQRTCDTTRQIWSEYNRKSYEDLISIQRVSISKIVEAIIRHWPGDRRVYYIICHSGKKKRCLIPKKLHPRVTLLLNVTQASYF